MLAHADAQDKLILFQKDYFVKRKRVFNNIRLVINNKINYLPLMDVLELLEYDTKGSTKDRFLVTDGSEFVSIPRKGSIATKEGIRLGIDPLITVSRDLFISLRSVNRLFNVEAQFTCSAKRVVFRQPGHFFVTLKGDTLKSISRLLNTTIKKLLAVNKNLKEPIGSGIKVLIPTIDFDAIPKQINTRNKMRIKQETELAPPIIALGFRLKGTPYRFGAAPYPKSHRFDCSSYTQYIYGSKGIRLPRTSRTQANKGVSIKQRDVEAGDLIFFLRDRYSDNRIGHVGVDIGNGNMLNTYMSPPGVTVTKWKSPYWLKRYVTAREIL